MKIAEFIYWIFIIIIFYNYIGYALIIYIFNKINRLKARSARVMLENSTYEPAVTLIIPTYNGEEYIREKIKNSLQIEYPVDKLEIIVVADGSTDGTMDIVRQYPQLKLLYKPERQGKIAAMNRAMPFVKNPITVFCDDNTYLNKDSLRKIVRHYQFPDIGGVAGEKRIMEENNSDGSGAGEGLYWKYESFLKKTDFEFHSVVGAAGELFSIRTDLFTPPQENVLLDDFILSLKICMKGYRFAYEPEAYAMEKPSFNIKEEKKRKIRISAGGFQSIIMLTPLLNIFKFKKLSFLYISHRVLRWAVSPFLLALLLPLNIFLAIENQLIIYKVLLIFQILFYFSAAIGGLLILRQKKSAIFYIPYYFFFMNAAVFLGLVRFGKKEQTVLWDKAKRSSSTILPENTDIVEIP